MPLTKSLFSTLLSFCLMMWNGEIPTWWDERGERCRHCDIALGWHWPSDDRSKRASSVSRLQLAAGNWKPQRMKPQIRGGLWIQNWPPAGPEHMHELHKHVIPAAVISSAAGLPLLSQPWPMASYAFPCDQMTWESHLCLVHMQFYYRPYHGWH